MRTNRGVSVRECALTCAILVAIAAVIAPAVTDSVTRAQQKACAANLAKLGTAFQLYLNDNSGRYPLGASLDETAAHGDWVWFQGSCSYPGSYYLPPAPWSWKINPSAGSLWNYTDKQGSTYICPCDTHAVDPSATTFRTGFGLSYAMNASIISGGYGEPVRTSPALFSDLVAPGRTILLCDGSPAPIALSNGTVVSRPQFDGVFRWRQTNITNWHSGGANLLVCDGHVKWVKAAYHRKLVWLVNGNVPAADIFQNQAAQE